MHRLKTRRQTKQTASLSPKPIKRSDQKWRQQESIVKEAAPEVKTDPQPSAQESQFGRESPSNTGTPSPCSHEHGGLLRLKTRSGWMRGTRHTQSEDFDHLAYVPRSSHKHKPISQFCDLPMVLSVRDELLELHAENVARMEHVVSQLQVLMKQRNNLYKDLSPMPPAERRSEGEIRVGDHRQEWMLMEMDRLNTEFDFKVQVVEILRTTLLKTKAQRAKLKSVSQFDHLFRRSDLESIIHDSSKSVMEGRMKDAQSSEVRQMESEIEDMENHLKLLNDALEDEKQENYKLASDNILLKQQLEELARKQSP